MDLPFDALLAALCQSDDAAAGWSACCDALHATAPSPIWAELRGLQVADDVTETGAWLAEQLQDAAEFLTEIDAGTPRGIALWLNPQALADGEGWSVEIGATATCEPTSDDMDWTDRCPWVGDFHGIAGIAAAEPLWLAAETAALRDLAEYTCFLLYGGLILRDALRHADLTGPWLVAWGFAEGDRGLLARGDGGTVTPLALLA